MAYASVASLTRTIESLLTSNSPMQSLTCDHRKEFRALHEKISSLEVVVKNFEKNNVSGQIADLEVEVKEVANIAEHTIQLRVTEVVLADDEKTRKRLSDSLQQAAKDIHRIWKKSTKIQHKRKVMNFQCFMIFQWFNIFKWFNKTSKEYTTVEEITVGRDDQRERLLNDLTTSYSGEPKVIPIVGMGGIGKTTLAKEVYDNKSVLHRFDIRSWATVSQQHNRKEILLCLLQSAIKMDDSVRMKGEEELADMLQKSLKRKRYLIVLDDIWSCEVWDGVRLCFPTEDNAGSRILLTTRNNEVACYADTENLSLQMDLMGPDESWSLLKSAAFSSEALPYGFEAVGKQIADECHGLPLTIVVVAGLLKSKRAIEDWESVAKDVKSFVMNDPDERCSRVLGLSYNHLTSDLKACLLHFGIFPEDSEIPVKNLKRTWIAEGFLKLENDLEGEAGKCLQELVDRCLVLVCKKSLDGTKIRSCKVHDLIYDLCVREIQRENIFIMNDIVLDQSDSVWGPLSMQKMRPFKRVTGDEFFYCRNGLYRALLTPVHRQLRDHDNNDLLKQTHSIFSFHLEDSFFPPFLKSELIHFKLLKVLELRHLGIGNFPVQILSLIWLRYLSLLCHVCLDIPREICRLWNLQTFIVQGLSPLVKINVPEEIWGLTQLRHLKLPAFYLPDCPSGSADKGSHPKRPRVYILRDCPTKSADKGRHLQQPRLYFPNFPSRSVDKGRHLDLSNLQTISYLSPLCCKEEVIMGIQNVKELGISGYETEINSIRDSGILNNLVHLQQLETLSFMWCSKLFPESARAFPATLKKLKLERTSLSWSYLDIIAELPNLEVLKLMDDACGGKEWHPIVRGFNKLKFLLIEGNYLKYWKATNDNFPVLERLMIRSCRNLKEIPIEFADIHTLQLIELRKCPPKLGESAARIQKEQEDLGNNPVDVCISDPYDDDDDDDDDDEEEYADVSDQMCHIS